MILLNSPPRNRHADDIAEKGPRRRKRGMASALQIGDQGGQLRTGQPAFLDVRRHGGLETPLAAVAPVFGTDVFFDGQRGPGDVDLLHDLGEVAIAMQTPAAAGTGIEQVFFEVSDLLGRKRHPLVLGVTGLATDLTRAGGIGGGGGRRFDDVGRRWLRGGRGVLPGSGKQLAQLDHLGPQGFDLRLQTAALRTRLPCALAHAAA
jgi:hypothetical protein